MDKIVYALCTVTSLICWFLLVRGYKRSQMRLLLWSSVCFAALAIANVVLFVDLVMLPVTVDLLPVRNALTCLGATILLVGLIWETV